MSKKKSGRPSSKPTASVGKKSPAPAKRSRLPLLLGAVAVIAVIAIVVSSGVLGGKSTSDDPYLGRFLPGEYEAPQVAEFTLYNSAIPMTVVPATQDANGFTVPLGQVVDSKIVRFDYTRPAGDVLPMIAYVRPSGRLFVGVSYCPPCEGEGQRIESDGTLTCEACGTRRNLEDNAGLSGACREYPLDEVPVTVQGDSIVVDSTVLDSWVAQPLDRPIG